jgi:hypothetical protein
VILNLSLVGRLNLQLHSALIAFRKSLRHSTIKMKNLTILLLFFAAMCQVASAQAPTITSFTPAFGPVGTLVTITGTNLSSPTAFPIGGVDAIAVSNDGTTLVGMVMPDAVTGAVSITTTGGTAIATGNFSVSPTPYPDTQQGDKLVGTGGVGTLFQGTSVSVSADGNTAIVGGNADDNYLGAVWVYIRTNGVWAQQGAKLVGTGAVYGSYGSWWAGMSMTAKQEQHGSLYE